jgi:DNA helicase II / ATP-dependent DNA helicase PcrA
VSVRRRASNDDDGPRIDTSYSQASEFSSGGVQGTRVHHMQFGDGTIVACDGEGPNAKVTVKFQSVGLKRIIARFLSPS